VVAHFHYVMVGGMSRFFAGLHLVAKITGECIQMWVDGAVIIFIGFN